MTTARTIAILTHQYQGLDQDYFLARCKNLWWDREGRRVLVHQGLGPPPEADLAFLHVDLTVVPADYRMLAASYPRCVNRDVVDISKRCVSRWLVGREDGYDGPVIVKTDLNHGGQSERRLRLAQRERFAQLHEAAERWLPRAWRSLGDYQVFERKGQVPGWVWRRKDLVVERFFFERSGDSYQLRQWFFLGDRGLVTKLLGPTPYVKWNPPHTQFTYDHYVPPALWQRRRELGMDFGKIDFLLQEDEPIVIDVNPTPHAGTRTVFERAQWWAGILAEGVDFVAGRSP
ncbi:MAG TPA: hypothetical protein VJL84_06875 [Kiloniellales bacterium]|nr:hypothetical protein [Kiloniellales bacterium]